MKLLAPILSAIGRAGRGGEPSIRPVARSRHEGRPRRDLLRITGLVVALVLLSARGGLAQTVDTSLWTTNGSVYSVVSDGSTIYIGGYFEYVGPVTGSAAAIDANTGAVQQPYPGVSAPGLFNVLAVAPDGNGGWYLGGRFTTVRGVPRNNLAQLDAAGNVTSWNPNANSTVTSLVVSGGTVYAGGLFTSMNGILRNHVAALDAMTGSPTTWNPNVNGNVYALALSGGTIYVGGTFTYVGPFVHSNIAAIDVATGKPRAWNPLANNSVLALAVDGGTVYAGGKFTSIGGQSRSRIAALDSVSGAATAWNPDPQSIIWSFPGVVQPPEIDALAIDGSTVYAGGLFTSIGGQSRRDLAALDAASGLATEWNPGVINVTWSPVSPGVLALAVSGGTVYVGGNFIKIGGQTRNYVAAVDATSGVATAWNPSVIGFRLGTEAVNALAVSGNTVYVGGHFMSAGVQPRRNLAALDATSGVATAWDPNPDSVVRALALSGGTVYAGGTFGNIGGQVRSKIAALDATTGAATAWDPNVQTTFLSNPYPEIDALAVSGGIVYAGGAFTSVGGQPRNNLAAIDETTGAATAWNPNVDWPGAYSPYATVYALAVGEGTVYAGGTFTTAGGFPRNHLCAIDAATGAVTAWNPNMQWSDPQHTKVSALAVGEGTVYAGGRFTTVGGQPRNHLCAISAATGLATAWNANANNVVGALVLSDASLYVGGQFGSIGGQPRSGIAALDPASAAANEWDPNANSGVIALAVHGDKVYAGGTFTRVGGQLRPYIMSTSAVDIPTATLLIRFDAAPSAEGIELRWSLSGESRVATVDVERASGVEGPWLAIAPERHDEPGLTVALDRTAADPGEHFYRLVAQFTDGGSQVFGPVSASRLEAPSRSDLTLLSSNPTSGRTQVQYSVARAGRVRLEVLDVSGRVEETLVDGIHTPGRHVVHWNGVGRRGRPAPGIYFVRLSAPDRAIMRKLAIIR